MHTSSYPLRVQLGFQTRYHADRTAHDLINIKEGLLIQFKVRLKLDVLILQDQIEHKAWVPICTL